MDLKQAFTVIEQSTNQATEKGVFSLKDISFILQALSVFAGFVESQTSEPKQLEKK